MLDIKFIRENKEEIKKAIKNKRVDLDLERLLALDDERLKTMREIESLQAEKNKINDTIRAAKSKEEREKIIAEGKEIKNKIDLTEPNYDKILSEYNALMIKVPTIPSADTPAGKGEEENKEVYSWGEKPKFHFKPKDHIEIGKNLDLLDLERGKKVAGYRGYYLKNEGAFLAMGLMMYALKKMVQKGYTPMIPPTLVKGGALFGSGYFKGLEYNDETDEIYQIASRDKEADGAMSKERKFLVGTSEPSLLAYYGGEVLNEKNLPLKMTGYSQCYRSEIGSYGRDTKGIYRVHEFMKVEQVVFCKADKGEAEKLQDEMLLISQEILEDLGLPYRKIIICTGDLSAGKYRQYDLEVWSAANNWYRESGSASIFLDWQSRRLDVKYKDANDKKQYVYMLNNTALATPRVLIAILENYQQADGSVKIPKVLQEYVGKEVIKAKK
ncbi:serine--tRNA ligase [Patescibacteria group bacterium]|nr:serine--tRNA ligase [Patescibacteria group bacterium]MBU4580567.1 serine--tRNA ligase [Patescibacteria group bacterium]